MNNIELREIKYQVFADISEGKVNLELIDKAKELFAKKYTAFERIIEISMSSDIKKIDNLEQDSRDIELIYLVDINRDQHEALYPAVMEMYQNTEQSFIDDAVKWALGVKND